MFLRNARLFLALVGIIFGIFLISKLKILVLVLSWAVILFCTWIFYVKCYGRDEKLKRRLDENFVRFRNSKFFASVSKFAKKFEGKKRR